MKALILALLLTAPLFGAYRVGDIPADECWDNTDPRGGKYCLHDGLKNSFATVLLYNAGWCLPCNTEFAQIARATEKFEKKNIIFISLSAEGWKHGSKPDMTFLKEWEKKYRLDPSAKAYWTVAASPKDVGRAYGHSSIPNAIVLDKNGKITWKAEGPSVGEIVRQAEKVAK